MVDMEGHPISHFSPQVTVWTKGVLPQMDVLVTGI